MSRPVLRYFGGKSRLAPWIVSHFPSSHTTYVEPFAGAASVLLQKERAQIEILNDLDGSIVHVFRMLRNRSADLERALRLTPYAQAEYAAAYEHTDDEIERARRCIVRSMMGVGSDSIHRRSGFRKYPHNRTGRFSQTICAHEWSTYPDHISTFAERLRGVQIECGDALDVMRRYDGPQTLHYVDPPYVLASRKTAQRRYAHEMTDDDHRRLAHALRAMRGMVVLSGYPSPLYDELYADWHVERHRGGVEVLWLNDAAERAKYGQPTLFGGAA